LKCITSAYFILYPFNYTQRFIFSAGKCTGSQSKATCTGFRSGATRLRQDDQPVTDNHSNGTFFVFCCLFNQFPFYFQCFPPNALIFIRCLLARGSFCAYDEYCASCRIVARRFICLLRPICFSPIGSFIVNDVFGHYYTDIWTARNQRISTKPFFVSRFLRQWPYRTGQ